MGKRIVISLFFVAVASCYLASASDPSPLQDFCVADNNSTAKVNGFACKNPMKVKADDFHFSGLHIAGNTTNAVGSIVTQVFAAQLPGLNTLGVSLARLDYAPGGINPPHTHPRATELFTVIEGTILVGFVTSNPENKLFTKVLQKGDAFVFPIGLVHFQFNVGKTNAFAIAGFNSQSPGAVVIRNAVFGSNPPIRDDVLAKAFQVDKTVIDQLQSKI